MPAPIVALPSVADGIPKAPAGLKKTGRDAWIRLWTAGRSWLSPQTDVDLLTRLCQAHDERAELRARIRRDGYIVENEKYGLVKHPAVSMLRKVEEQITRYESLCGFTPSDRSRLGLAEVKKVSKLEELMARRQERAAN